MEEEEGEVDGRGGRDDDGEDGYEIKVEEEEEEERISKRKAE